MADKKEKEKGKGTGNGLKIIIIALLFFIVVGLGFGGYFIYAKLSSNNTNNTSININTSSNVLSPSNELSPYTYSLDEFLVNLSDEGGKRLIKTKIFLGYDTKKKKDMDKELEEKKAAIRDAVNGILRSKKAADLVSQKSIEDLKKEILSRINPYFVSGKATNVYFNDILIQ